jgi:radical SAM superfamily enzyme YgiQ (UPF0313 family)
MQVAGTIITIGFEEGSEKVLKEYGIGPASENQGKI